MTRTPRLAAISCALVGLALGCGSKSETKAKPKDDAAVSPTAAPLAMPMLGVDQIKRFNFIYEAGAAAYDKAVTAAKKKDWATARTQAEAALAKDAAHLGAHRLLAAALAQTGDPAAAVDHLVTAIAGDAYLYAPTLADDDLQSFMASPHGASVAALTGKIQEEYARRIASGLWLVGRRSAFKWPKDPGVQASTTRAELYAFDRETKRFFRLTHTDHQVAGFVRPAQGNEVAIVGFDKIDRAKPDAASDADAAPQLARAWIRLYDTVAWKPSTPRISLPAAREVSLGYAAGDQLLVSTAPSSGRWTTGPASVSSVDRTTGKLTTVTTALPATRVALSLDEGRVVRVPDGVVASWTGDPPVTASIKTTAGQPIQVPESGAAAQATITASPGGSHVAFATAVDPCAKDAAPSLYVADAKTGTYKHLLSARSRFATRWLDANVLAYEDGDGAIRLWDATTGREAMRLDNKLGIALDVLSLAPAPLCKQAPPTIDAAGSGASDEPLPPEEPAGSAAGAEAGSAAGSGSGPVTAPR